MASDLEDWGQVEVSTKCFGAMTCRVLAPLFQEVKAKSRPAYQAPGQCGVMWCLVTNHPVKSDTMTMDTWAVGGHLSPNDLGLMSWA